MNVNIFDIIEKLKDSVINKKNTENGLLKGSVGELIFLLEYKKIFPVLNEDLDKKIEEIIRNLYSVNFGKYNLIDGLAGVATAFQILSKENSLEVDESFFEDIDIQLLNCMKYELKKYNFDLFTGSNGYLIYFLERNSQVILDEIIPLYLDSLSFFLNNNELLHSKISDSKDKKGEFIYKNVINLGIPHGLTGIVMALIKINEYSLNYKSKIIILLDKLFELISRGKNPDDYLSMYSSVIFENKNNNSRLAWCYGDLCVAYSFIKSGKSFSNQRWLNEGKFIAIKSTNRNFNDAGIMDSGFCHGFSGVYFMYNMLQIDTDLIELIETKKNWLNHLVSSLTNNFNEYNHYLSYTGDNDVWVENNSILDGASGIGLVLLSTLNPNSNYWKNLFLL